MLPQTPQAHLLRQKNRVVTTISVGTTKARLAGLEPATYGLEVRCSIQLSYKRSATNPTQVKEGLFSRGERI